MSELPYQMTARLYDRIYSFKDYHAEAEKLRQIIALHLFEQTPHSMLDVACGTGAHLAALQPYFERVAGVDLMPDFAEIARAKLPDADIQVGDMRTFKFSQQFEVVTCLFSAIGYMTTIEDLQAAFSNMAAHVAPNGILLVEGWFTPEQFHPGHIGLLTIEEPTFKLARMNNSWVEGHVSLMDMHHLVGTPDNVTHFVERHAMGLYTVEQYMQAVQNAGLHATHDPQGLTGRSLFIGVKRR